MISSKRALALSVLLLASGAASATDTTYTFASVTKIESVSTSTINLTGVLVNDTVPSTAVIPNSIPLCAGHMETVLKNPGAYILSITTRYVQYPNGIISFTTERCSLELAP